MNFRNPRYDKMVTDDDPNVRAKGVELKRAAVEGFGADGEDRVPKFHSSKWKFRGHYLNLSTIK